jgi:hypothetical protein
LGLDEGGKFARATYDTYAEYGFAATSWTYKVVSIKGGQNSGTWGLVTNAKVGQLAKANSWSHPAGWDLTFSEVIKIDFVGERTYYVVLKAGSTGSEGNFDIAYDNISLIKNDATQDELLINGGFGSDEGWTQVKIGGNIAFDYNSTASTNPKLRFYRSSGSSYVNGAVYQPVTLTGGQRYTLGGDFKDNGSLDSWAEVYLLETEPQKWVNIKRDRKKLDFENDSKETIQSMWSSYGTDEYEIHDGLQNWLTASEPSGIFEQQYDVATTIPARIQSEAYANMQGIVVESGWDNTDGYGMTWNIGYADSGEYSEYVISVPSSRKYMAEYRMASSGGSNDFVLSVDGNTVAYQDVPGTGGRLTWDTISSSVDLPAGNHTLRFTARGGGSFKIDWFELF